MCQVLDSALSEIPEKSRDFVASNEGTMIKR